MGILRFSKDHAWVRIEGDEAVIGITDYAQTQLGDIVHFESPDLGRDVAQGKPAATVESVKAASELYAPVSGEVKDVNVALADDPTKINADPMGEGWLFKLKLKDTKELEGLLDEPAYRKLVEALGGANG